MAAEELYAHLNTGATTTCRAWALTRRDGVVYGFTDHDRDLEFGGLRYSASSGMTASALQQSTGLSVDNTEASGALGALSDVSVTEADILAGRFDGAEIRCWQVNWAEPTQRVELFRGSLGEILRAGGLFRAELRGLSEALNATRGQVFHARCSAVLGDGRCRFDLNAEGYSVEGAILSARGRGDVTVAVAGDYATGWFEGGRMTVLDGDAAGLIAQVRADPGGEGARRILLWEELPAAIAPGDRLRLAAGCDHRAVTCREKFANFLNFRGFPHIPGEDWLTAYPKDGQAHDGSGWTL